MYLSMSEFASVGGGECVGGIMFVVDKSVEDLQLCFVSVNVTFIVSTDNFCASDCSF